MRLDEEHALTHGHRLSLADMAVGRSLVCGGNRMRGHGPRLLGVRVFSHIYCAENMGFRNSLLFLILREITKYLRLGHIRPSKCLLYMGVRIHGKWCLP
jgi:hypothetical protein